MKKMKRIAAMTAALLICSGAMGYLPARTLKIGGFAANAAGDAVAESVAIDATNFPDEIFRQYVVDSFDKDGDGVLSAEEIAAVTKIDVDDKGISDLTGIEHFTVLNYLHCISNKLTSLDVSNNSVLIDLHCGYNQLTSLDVSNNTALELLWCDFNQLKILDVSKNIALRDLKCERNQLTSLDVSNNTKLIELYCYENQLTSLDISNNSNLIDLICGYNQLASLDVSKNTILEYLSCYNNQLTSLDVSNNNYLTYLICNNNQLASLEIGEITALKKIMCSDNQLTTLNVSNYTALEELSCYNNYLKTLNVSNNTSLKNLFCYNNHLTVLDVSDNAALEYLSCGKNRLTTLDVSNNKALESLSCGNNQLTSLDVSNNSKLNSIESENNSYKINLTNNTFDLSTLPAGFDITKASDWTNGTVNGNILTVEDTSKEVTYKYDCGNEQTAAFTLIPTTSTETPENPPVSAPAVSLGDISGDGSIDSSDATLVLSDYAVIATGGKSTFTAEQAKAADVDGDGKYDSIDASVILAYYAYTSTGGTGTIEEYLSKADAENQLKALREKKESEVQLFAAAYIGCTDDMNEVDAVEWIKENSPVFCENYSFVENIPAGQIAGTHMGELYCIVPFDENSTVVINRAVYDENGNGSYENVIYRSESGEPVLLFCNNSGVDGDTQVTVTDSDGNRVVWFPCLDERLMLNCPYNADYDTYVYDFSQYQEILEKEHTARKNSGWKLPTAADLQFTNWSGVDYRGSEVIGSYKIEFGEDTAYIKWVDGDEEHEFKDVEWKLEVEKDTAVVTFDFKEFAGILQYNFLLNETGGMLYTAVNFTNEDTLDENLKLYRLLDRYETIS